MDTIEQHVLGLLESAPTSLPLPELRDRLAAFTDEVPSERLLRERIRSRPDLFLLLAPDPLPWLSEGWTEAERAAYAAALDRAGSLPQPRVAAATATVAPPNATGPQGTVRRLDAALVTLWAAAAPDDRESRCVWTEALRESAQIRATLLGDAETHA